MEDRLNTFRPHDLLWVTEPEAFMPVGPEPAWLKQHWTTALPVVVRREQTSEDVVAVGIRGSTRDQRLAGYAKCDAIVRCVSPEDLVQTLSHRPEASHLEHFRCLIALQALSPLLEQQALPWGPTGSVGYALATNAAVLHTASDLDLLVRAQQPLLPAQRQVLRAVAHYGPCKVDIQIDTPRGGFAFKEWDSQPKATLLRTGHGPQLVACPWQGA